MSEYTPGQIKQAKREAQLLVDIYGSAHGQIFFCTDDGKKHDIEAIVKTILTALFTAEDQLKRYEWVLAETEALVMSHEGHIAKLEARLQEAGLISVKKRLQFAIRSEANDD